MIDKEERKKIAKDARDQLEKEFRIMASNLKLEYDSKEFRRIELEALQVFTRYWNTV